MRNRFYSINKIGLVILFFWITGSCNSIRPSPTRSVILTPSPVKEISKQPSYTSSPPVIVTASETSQVKPTVSPTLTITPSQTPYSQSWDTKATYYGSIIIADREYNLFFLFQPDGLMQKTYPLEYDPIRATSIADGCTLIAIVFTQEGHKLVRVDRNGEIQGEIFSIQNTISNTVKFLPINSPTGKYISYVVFSGELYYDTAKYQDVEIVTPDHPDQPIRLTTHGGAWKNGGVWSPDGTQIAYTDYDEGGVRQVYVTNINDLTKQKLTQFPNQGPAPGPIYWASRGDRLAVIFEDQQHNQEVWIIPVRPGPAYKLNLPKGIVTIGDRIFWSEDDTKFLLHVGDYTGSNLAGLYWFDVDNNRLLHVLTEVAATKINPGASSFSITFPITTDLSSVVFYTNTYEWYSYSVVSGQIDPFSRLNTRHWGLYMYVSLFHENIFSCKR